MRSDLRPGSRRNHGEGSEPRSARAARLRRCAATIALSKAKSTHRSRAPSLGSSLRRRVAQPFCRRSVGLGRRSANRTGDTEAPSHGLDRGHGVRGQDSRCIEALLSIAHARDGVAQEDPGGQEEVSDRDDSLAINGNSRKRREYAGHGRRGSRRRQCYRVTATFSAGPPGAQVPQAAARRSRAACETETAGTA